jgi:integrase/recombinase XerD
VDHQLATTVTGELVQGDPGDRARAAVLGFLLGYRNTRTRDAYATDLRGFLGWCQGLGLDPLTDVTRTHLEGWSRHLESDEGLSPSTVARKLAAVCGMYAYATDEGLTTTNPGTRVRRPSVPADSPTLGLDLTEARLLLAVATRPRDRALLTLLTLNGLRVSEACNADVTDLGTERGHRVLTVTRKRGRVEQVPLAPLTVDAVNAYLDGRTDGPLFTDDRGDRLDRHDAARIVARVARAAGIGKHLTPHGLRHTAVTLALDAGVPLRDVQDMAGHADPRTTRRYDRARQSLDRHATYALAGYLGAA